jgi:hypothetical protein
MLVTCRNCQIEFWKIPAEIKRTRNNYCSKPCKGQFLAKESIKMFFLRTTKNGDCMEWDGAPNQKGYGVTRFKGRLTLAHRVSYILSHGEIGDELVLHKCDNRKCVNPAHLYAGTHHDNVVDMITRGRKHTKLKFNDVLRIRESGASNAELAAVYGVSRECIRDARNPSRWRYPPAPPEGMKA